MGNLNLKQKQTIETKRLIIDTVFTLLKEQPLDEITIQSICKKANISVGAFYHHYSSKEEVLAESFKKFDTFVSTVLVNKHYNSLNEAIIDFLFHLVIGSQENGVNVTREVLKLALKDPIYFEDQERFSRKYLRSIVSKAIEEGELKSDTDVNFLCSLLLRHTLSLIHIEMCIRDRHISMAKRIHIKSFKPLIPQFFF